MTVKNFKFIDPDGFEIFVYKWMPQNVKKARGVVQLAHGMGEFAARYERFARVLTSAGYVVYANDHRGHGKTAKTLENVGYIGDKDAFNGMVRDMYHLNGIIHNEFPKLPVFLFGHSMGSFLSQCFIETYKFRINGVVLCATAGPAGPILNVGLAIAVFQSLFKGNRYRSLSLAKMTFGGFNNGFRPNRTHFDWLTRDKKEVDAYVANPYCGGIFTASFFRFFYGGLKQIHRPGNIRKIPHDLPILFVSGDKDPVGQNTKSVNKLMQIYQNIGIKDITCHFYKDGRHEILNELNRDQVTKDIIDWLNKQV